MAISEVITLRVGSDVKRRMEELGPGLNWSEELRLLLERRLRQLANAQAMKLIEEAHRGKPRVPAGTAARLIREDRDA